MKYSSVLWVIMFTVFAFMSFALSTQHTIPLSPPGLASQHQVTVKKVVSKNRRLKGIGAFSNPPKMNEAGNNAGAYLDDYRPIDPSPSSKASIRPGPIQHGTPYMPYIPKLSSPPPPGHPRQGSLP